MRSRPRRVVFLVDVDNTLLDNDAVAADLKRFLRREFGAARQRRYWAHFEALRRELGYADYLGALQRYRADHPADHKFLEVSSFLIDYPFARRLFPRALDVLRRLKHLGPAVIFSDGDAVFQPRKVKTSGLDREARGHVLIYVHKERHLREVERLYPGRHYVLIDDKPRILTSVKKQWKGKVTTVFPRQGHYARSPAAKAMRPPADVSIRRIGDLLRFDWGRVLH